MSGVQSIERAFSVLRRLSSGPAGVTDIAERADLPKSTVSRILSTLEGLGAVEQTSPGGPYRIGAAMLDLVSALLPGRGLLESSYPHLLELTDATGEATGIAVLEGDCVHYLEQVESDNPVQVRDWSGTRVPLHAVPSGLVLLAWAPAARQRAYLHGELKAFTPKTIVSPSAIAQRLDEVRTQGYAWVFEEFSEGINSVAAPIRDATGEVIAAVHSHGPAYRFPLHRSTSLLGEAVVAAATRISGGLRSNPTAP